MARSDLAEMEMIWRCEHYHPATDQDYLYEMDVSVDQHFQNAERFLRNQLKVLNKNKEDIPDPLERVSCENHQDILFRQIWGKRALEYKLVAVETFADIWYEKVMKVNCGLRKNCGTLTVGKEGEEIKVNIRNLQRIHKFERNFEKPFVERLKTFARHFEALGTDTNDKYRDVFLGRCSLLRQFIDKYLIIDDCLKSEYDFECRESVMIKNIQEIQTNVDTERRDFLIEQIFGQMKALRQEWKEPTQKLTVMLESIRHIEPNPDDVVVEAEIPDEGVEKERRLTTKKKKVVNRRRNLAVMRPTASAVQFLKRRKSDVE